MESTARGEDNKHKRKLCKSDTVLTQQLSQGQVQGHTYQSRDKDLHRSVIYLYSFDYMREINVILDRETFQTPRIVLHYIVHKQLGFVAFFKALFWVSIFFRITHPYCAYLG